MSEGTAFPATHTVVAASFKLANPRGHQDLRVRFRLMARTAV
jgi:hypothetical protein